MKRYSTFLLIAAVTIAALSSCTKETVSGSGTSGPREPLVVDLLANQWVNPGDRIYVDDFKNIVPPGYGPDNGGVSVLLMQDGGQTDIDRPVMISGHALWATVTSTDVVLHYNAGRDLVPFPSFNIRVVIRLK